MNSIAETDEDPARLMQRVATGDRAAFAIIYDQVAATVFGVTRRVLRDRAQAEEVAQEVFLELWRTAAKFDPERAGVNTWVAVMAHRRSVDRVRSEQSDRNRRAREAAVELDPGPEPDDVLVRRDEHQAVAAALGDLSDVQREAIVLAYYEGMTQQEISERLDVPLGTVKTRVRDGLTRLRQRWEVRG